MEEADGIRPSPLLLHPGIAMKTPLRIVLLAALGAGAVACDDPTGAATPAQVAVTAGAGQTAPVATALPNPVAVRVTDDDGDPVSGVEVRFTVIRGGGSVSPAVDSTDAGGAASTVWTLGTVAADSQQLQVQVMHNGTAVTSTIVHATAQPGAGTVLTRVSGDAQTGGVGTRLADSLVVRLVDPLGNPVPGVTVRWQVSPYGGTLSPLPSVTRADGTARVAWTLGVARGQAQVQADVPTIPGVAPVGFSATATSPIVVSIQSPLLNRTYGSALPVSASATTTAGTIVRMVARVQDREVELNDGNGTLNLAGLPEGPQMLAVVAYSSAGDSAAGRQPFVYNQAPQLTAVLPAEGTVIRNGVVRVDAECTDPSGCVRVAVHASEFGEPFPNDLPVLAEGMTSVHADVPISEYDGRRVYLVVRATDALGGVSVAYQVIYVEDTPTWTELASGGRQALDTDATRFLYVDSAAGGAAQIKVRALAGGAETVLLDVPAGEGRDVEGYLFPGGAIFATRHGIYEWRSGNTTLLAASGTAYSLDVAGPWAAWSVSSTLYRRNLTTGSTQVVTTQSVNNGNEVAPNGDVAYTRSTDYDIVWWRGAAIGGLQVAPAQEPLTDGTQVMFVRGSSIWLYRTGDVEVLATLALPLAAHLHYEVNNGWAAWVTTGAGNSLEVWTLDPTGTRRRASSGGSSTIRALGPQGQVVFATGGRRYLVEAPYTSAPLDIGGDIGTLRFEGDELYVFVGRSAFRVNY
jgi:hypothetical protein